MNADNIYLTVQNEFYEKPNDSSTKRESKAEKEKSFARQCSTTHGKWTIEMKEFFDNCCAVLSISFQLCVFFMLQQKQKKNSV